MNHWIHSFLKFYLMSMLIIRIILGNTILHILTEKKSWQKFTPILSHKKLSIYIKNNDGKTILDMVPLIERETFII